jgi:hypothetical protein
MKLFLKIATMVATLIGIVFLIGMIRQRRMKKQQFYI